MGLQPSCHKCTCQPAPLYIIDMPCLGAAILPAQAEQCRLAVISQPGCRLAACVSYCHTGRQVVKDQRFCSMMLHGLPSFWHIIPLETCPRGGASIFAWHRL